MVKLSTGYKLKKSQLRLLTQSKLLQLLSSYVTIKDIAKELNLKTNSVYVSFKRYIKKGWINQDRTLTTEGILKCQQGHGLFKSVNSIKQDTVRGHNIVFTISTRHIKKWNKRQEFLNLKDIKFKKVGYNWNGESLIVDNIKVWLTPLSVVLYMPNYFGEDSNIVFKQALDDLFFKFIPKLERLLETSLKDINGYKIRVSRQHYGLVKNALATGYYRENKKLYVRDEKGLWLVIDNSLNLKELETVHSKTSRDDNLIVQDFFNDLKQNPVTPSEILGLIKSTSLSLTDMKDNALIPLTEQIKLHLEVQRETLKTLKKIQESLEHLGTAEKLLTRLRGQKE